MSGLRRGKWTAEEEAYVERIIHDFENGLLPVGVGVTLRSYLSEKLNCDPMRITKKFTGSASIGKRIFHPCERTPATADSLARAHRELKEALQQDQCRTALPSSPNSPVEVVCIQV